MPNALITPTKITRTALAVLHEKLTIISQVNRSYDDDFMSESGKIGNTLKLRLPNEYLTGTGKTVTVSDVTEKSVDLVMANRNWVTMGFSAEELSLEIEDFTSRHIEPAMSKLASVIEAAFLDTVTPQVYNEVGTPGTTPNDIDIFLAAKERLNQMLAPKTNDRKINADSPTIRAMVKALSGLFQDSKSLGQQYVEGTMGRASGFDWFENERIHVHTNGDNVVSAGPVLDTFTFTDGISAINVTGLGATKTVKAGSVFTVAGVYAVHPETKQAYSWLKQFVVTEDVISTGGGAATIKIDPTIYLSTNPRQNVSAVPATDAALIFRGAASIAYGQNLAFTKDAFAFVSGDLYLPKGIDMGARERMDGISMRLARDWNVISDDLVTRIDVIWGAKAIRPELAVRITK